jgi:hypothetical protein
LRSAEEVFAKAHLTEEEKDLKVLYDHIVGSFN